MKSKLLYCLYIFLLTGIYINSVNAKEDRSQKKKIVYFEADRIEYTKEDDRELKKLIGNVIFKKEEITIQADTALYEDDKMIRGEGNVKIINNNGAMILTDLVEYDVDREFAEFNQGVTLIDGDDVLISDKGVYNDSDERAKFYENVSFENKKQRITCNTFIYENLTPTYIERHPDLFKGVDESKKRKVYIADGNVDIVGKKDKVKIKCDRSIHFKEKKKTKLFGRAILYKDVKKDPFYIYANQFLLINEGEDDNKMIATGNPRLYSERIQARSRSLEYSPSDSSIKFSEKPIFWNNDNQITSENAELDVKDEKIRSMVLNENVLLIQKDKLKNYNQIKGDKLTVKFKDSKPKLVQVKGNAESIQYIDDQSKDPKLIAVNFVKCERIKIKIKKEKADKIIFLGVKNKEYIVPGSTLPPSSVVPPAGRFPNFSWRIWERPTYSQVDKLLNKRNEILI